MTPQKIVEEMNETIKNWAKDAPKLVIGLDGYTGVGKTTLLNNLVAINPGILAVNRDDFLFSRENVGKKLSKTEDHSEVFELEVCDDKKLEDFIIAFKKGEVSKRIMVVEGVFMFHPDLPLNKLWDKRIYLEGDIAKIDERRIKREKEKWGKDYFPETHPDSHFRQVTIGLKRYIELYKPLEKADLVLKVD